MSEDHATPRSISSTAISDLLERVTDSVRQHASLEDTLDTILLAVTDAISVDRSVVFSIDREAQRLVAVAGRLGGERWVPPWQMSRLIDPVHRVVDDQDLLLLEDEALERFVALRGAPLVVPPASLVMAPITIDGASWGIVTLARVDPGQGFSDQELSVIRGIAGLMAIAVQAAIGAVGEREQRRLAQRMLTITAAFNHARTPESAARTLLRGTSLLTGIDHAYTVIFASSRHDPPVVLLGQPLHREGTDALAGTAPLDHPVERELLRRRAPILGSAFRAMLDQPGVEPPPDVHGLGVLPIQYGDTLDGALYLWTEHAPGSPRFSELSDTDRSTLASLCEQTAVALARTRLQQLAQRTAHEQRTLGQIATRISAASTPAEMADEVLRQIDALIPITHGRVGRCSGDPRNPEILATSGTLTNPAPLQPWLALIEHWVRDAEEPWTGPLGTWLAPGADDAGLKHHIVACLPLGLEDDVTGTMTLVCDSQVTVGQHEREIVTHAATQLALGLQRAASHEQTVVARDEAEQHAASIERIVRISTEMSRQHRLDDLFDTMELGLRTLVPHEAHALHRADEARGRLDLVHGTSLGDTPPVPVELPFGDPVTGRAARLRKPAQGLQDRLAVLSVPMLIEGSLLGTITLWRDEAAPFTDNEVSLLGIFAAHAGSELLRAEMSAQRRELHLGSIRALVSTVDMRDPFTRGHSARVGRLARLLAERLHLTAEQTEFIEVAGLLHDVGKIGIPDRILQKPGPLDDHERAVMMGHAELGARIVREAKSPALEGAAALIRHHHEWWDGRGYPAGLRGEEIPIGAQIIGVADAWDTMTNDRPYRPGLTPADAWARLAQQSGGQFSPAVIDALDALRRAEVLAPPPATPPAATATARQHPEGPLGDLRSLGILVDLAQATRHLTDPATLMREILALLAERLDIAVALVLEPAAGDHAVPEAIARGPDGFQTIRCDSADVLDRILATALPADLATVTESVAMPNLEHIFTNPRNTGVAGLLAPNLPRGLLIFQPSDDEHYWRLDLPVVETVAPHVAAVIDVARIHQRAREDALTDGLTGLANYRGFHRVLAEQLEAGTPFTLLMCDVVGLKALNDTVGHVAGDELLRQMGALLQDLLPDAICIARMGGDEFGVIVDTDSPRTLVERITVATRARIAPMYALTIGVRVGWADAPREGTTAHVLIDTADRRMYDPDHLPSR